MKSAVIAFSGGLDSTTLLYSILRSVDKITAVFFVYGSRHNEREWAAASKIIEQWKGIELMQVNIPTKIFKGSTSALLNESHMPHKTYEELSKEVGPSPTVVPFRNGIIISMCAAIAASKNCESVYIAAHSTDALNWAYPDCSPEFLGSMANAIYVGTYGKVRLRMPFTWATKRDIVLMAGELGVPIELTRSCYEATDIACGVCPTCVERIEAFRSQGYIDPIEYMGIIDWDHCSPWPFILGERK